MGRGGQTASVGALRRVRRLRGLLRGWHHGTRARLIGDVLTFGAHVTEAVGRVGFFVSDTFDVKLRRVN